MTEYKKTANSVILMVLLTVLSKVLGLFREMLIASNFGSGIETDILFVSIAVTTLFTALIAKVINTTVIPVLAEVRIKEGLNGKRSNTNNLLNILIIISVTLTVIGLLFTPLLVRIMAIGFTKNQLDAAVTLTRIGFPVIIFSTILGVFRAYLHTENSFFESAATQFPYNIVLIIYLVFMSTEYGYKGFMIASVIAVISQIVIQIPSLVKHKYFYEPIVNLKNPYYKKVLYLIAPVLISAAAGDINSIMDQTLASTLSVGSISALNYSNKLNSLITSIFIAGITTVLFPLLSKVAVDKDFNRLNNILNRCIGVILLITIPSTVGMILFAEPIVRILLERGEFTTLATNMTSSALVFYSIGLSGLALKLLLDKTFYALQNTRTPMIIGVVSVVLNVILNLIFIRFFDFRGLAFATSLSALLSSFMLTYLLNKVTNFFNTKKTIILLLKVSAVSLLLGIVALGLFNIMSYRINLPEIFIFGFVVLFYGLLYFISLYLLQIEDIKWIINIFKK